MRILLRAATICLLAVVTAAAQDALALPDGVRVEAVAATGQGHGLLTLQGGRVRVEAEATGLGTVVDNVRSPGAILDFLLPQPIALPDCDRLAVGVINPTDGARGVSLRLIVRDSRGGLWAVSTRRAGLGAIPRSGPGTAARIETFPWQTSELGRADPSAVQALDPAKHDEYDAPRPPLALAGVRLTFSTTKACAFALCDLRPARRSEPADPYWLIERDRLWEARGVGRNVQRVGWGPDEPVPTLRAAAFGLGTGVHACTWEMLASDGWTVVASGAGTLPVDAAGAGELTLPLPAAGTYRLLAAVARPGAEPLEIASTCLVVRNAAAVPVQPVASVKPLRLDVPAGSHGIISAGGEAWVAVGAIAGPGELRWRVDSGDGRELATGASAAAQGARIDLLPFAQEGRALFVTVRLVRDGTVVDIARRIAGFRSQPAASTAAPARPDAKLAPLAGSILRYKGDYHEGETPVVSQADAQLPVFAAWLEDARQIGYNVVELSAPWYDLEPLPGVRQFAVLDRLVAEARQRGLRVTFRIHPIPSQVPAWVAREYQEDEDRAVHGLWRGSSNMLFSPASPGLRRSLNGFLEALAAHYRDDAFVVGYTVENLFFDHGLLDEPWTGQAVDYSATAQRSFVEALRVRYGGDLAAASAAHGVAYRTWEAIAIPHPQPLFDAAGRLQARTDALWRDWTAHKVAMIADFRAGAVEALRRGDPGCAAGTYLAEDTPLWLERQVALAAFIACGSMEDQYPPESYPVPTRREPHGKHASGATLVDIGMTNILFTRPGHESFFNYWYPQWRLAQGRPNSVSESVREAEGRLQQWFRVADRLVGAQPAGAPATRRGAVAFPLDALLLSFQHTFTPRAEDQIKPFSHRAGAEKLRLDTIHDREVDARGLAGRPWLYLPYCANVLGDRQADELAAWIEAGGRLVIEPTSGYWRDVGGPGNLLGRRLGLPDCPPVSGAAPSEREALAVAAGSPLAGLELALRTDRFQPPIQDQPVPFIHNIPRAFLRPYALQGAVPAGAQVVANGAGGRPAAYLLNRGRGQVLVFCGVVDWLASPGLARRIDDWGCGRAASTVPDADPELLASAFVRGSTQLVVGRRFIGHAARTQSGRQRDGVAAKALAVAMPQIGAGRWRVRELVGGHDCGVHDAAELRTPGVTLELRPGEGFLLEAVAE
jgi:hypothetical protein